MVALIKDPVQATLVYCSIYMPDRFSQIQFKPVLTSLCNKWPFEKNTLFCNINYNCNPLNIFIGIDDTDNLETRGTGFHARMLGQSLAEAGLFEMKSVSRHQLLVDKRIPFTSHNSSACLAGICTGNINELIEHAKIFLKRESAFDSDAGLCVAPEEEVTPAIVDFGNRAKREILSIHDAYRMIVNTSVYLEGFLNTRIGLIGSLAAVGLRAGGNDGRLLWTRNLRETTGEFPIREFLERAGIDRVIERYHHMSAVTTDMVAEKEFPAPDLSSVIRISEWCRPVMIGGKITLIAEKTDNTEPYEYQSASKDYIKSISE